MPDTDAPIVVSVPITFEQPLDAGQRRVIERVGTLMLVHQYEIHDFWTDGEQITRVPVQGHILRIEPVFDDDKAAECLVRFEVASREDKELLVWTSSLMFQYIHYHIARLLSINHAPHTLDWEARQDPGAPERVKGWVEGGGSRIERLKRVQQSET